MNQYRALIFDLCDTIMPYQTDQLPQANIRGTPVRTTTPLLYDCFKKVNTSIPYEQFHDLFVANTESIVALRTSGEEITSTFRFERFLDRLNTQQSNHRAEIHREFLRIHLGQVANCIHCPDKNRALLMALRKSVPLGLITNFDDVKTVYSVLDREGVRELFDTILISAEFGLRKPRKEIFLAACQNLKIDPRESLFIGDSLPSDVAGAKGVGMDVVWINPNGDLLPEGAIKPNHILAEITDLPSIL